MSEDHPPRPKNYRPGTGNNRYARFCEDWLGLERTEIFDRIARALDENDQTLVIGGNGLGKSYSAAALGVAALYCNPHTVVPVTAGNGDTLKNSIWKPIKGFFKRTPLPGNYKDNDRSLHTELDPEWFLECHSPKHPEDLEGDHNANVIYIIEEAEKPGVTHQHIDSARSTLGEDDHILVLANPPEDETNVVHDLEGRDSWNVLRFPTWESRNARVDRGLSTREKIGGLSGVGKMRDDWREYHGEDWPGIQTVIEWSSPYVTESGEPTVRETDSAGSNPEFRDDLHSLWYKRRAGVMPPGTSEKWRPFTPSDVEAAYNRSVKDTPESPECFTVDVARSGDDTVGTGKWGRELRVKYAKTGTNHRQQREELTDLLYQLNSPELAVDAVGEGSGLADELNTVFPSVTRYSNGAKPREQSEYYDCWAEALASFGEFLDGGGAFHSKQLYDELMVAARTIEFSTRSLTSRGGDVIEATSKSEVKERLGHSPDYMDSAIMCTWLSKHGGSTVVRRTGNRSRMGNTQ